MENSIFHNKHFTCSNYISIIKSSSLVVKKKVLLIDWQLVWMKLHFEQVVLIVMEDWVFYHLSFDKSTNWCWEFDLSCCILIKIFSKLAMIYKSGIFIHQLVLHSYVLLHYIFCFVLSLYHNVWNQLLYKILPNLR